MSPESPFRKEPPPPCGGNGAVLRPREAQRSNSDRFNQKSYALDARFARSCVTDERSSLFSIALRGGEAVVHHVGNKAGEKKRREKGEREWETRNTDTGEKGGRA